MMEATSVRQTTEAIGELWESYRETRCDDVREKLALQFIPLVKHVVGRMFAHLPPHVSREDLLNSGVLGLIDAIERYDPGRKIKFETYAIPRIKGAILDELRSYDLMPRAARLKVRKLQKTIKELEVDLKRSPTESEIASKLGIDVEGYRELLSVLSPIRFFSLSDRLDEQGACRVSGGTGFDTVALRDGEVRAESQEMKRVLLEALQGLPKNERIVTALYYYEEMTMKEIAVVLKVSESRVSQIHTQAILRLRSAVEKAMM